MELIEKMDARTHLAKLVSKNEVAKDTFELIFELEHQMVYLPGQYVWIEIPNMYIPDMRGNRRAFSLTSIPDSTTRISILFRSTQSGFNQSLRALNPGDELNIWGPFGFSFCLPEDQKTPLVLIAGGVGVAPFLGLLRYTVSIKSDRKITLIVANDLPERIGYLDELEGYNKNTHSVITKSVIGKLSEENITDLSIEKNSLVYVCGPQGFVDHAHAILKTKGVFDHQFHFEYFYPTTTIDKELLELFVDGKPKISQSESPQARQRAMLTYELVNSTATHTVVTDIRGRIIFANEASQKITGYTLQEMLGNTPRLWGGLMSRDFYKKLWNSKLRGEIFSGEIVNHRKNGEIYFAAAHISPIKNKNGEVIGFIGSEEDITDVRRSEQKATENEKRFVELTEKIPEVYWIMELSPVEKVVYVNSAFEKIWGIAKEELYNNSRLWTESIAPEDKQRVINMFDLFINNKSGFDIEFHVVRTDSQTVIVRAQAELVLGADDRVERIVGLARDITKEKTIDQEKSEFVSFASHQFKTPVTATRWNIESLLAGKYGELSPKQKEIMQGIHTMNARIDELISNMLNVSRIEQGVFLVEPIPTDFIELCNEVLMEAEPYIVKKEHVLEKKFDENLPKVPADPKLLRIVFQNYISNAIKYTPTKGRITVTLKIDGGNILFSVGNNGDPVPEAEQAKIFSKMFRASNAPEQDSGGTGLGLYIVKEIFENCGGSAWFTSKKGEDTVFYATIPLSGMIRKEGAKSLI